MRTFKVFIEGEPVAQGRPRITTSNGYARAYDPEECARWKRNVAHLVKLEMRRMKMGMFEEHIPLQLEVVVYRKPPSSWSNRKKKRAVEGRVLPVTKPDLSNYLKGIEDALNGVLYSDDSAIVEEHLRKSYAEIPGVLLEVKEIFHEE